MLGWFQLWRTVAYEKRERKAERFVTPSPDLRGYGLEQHSGTSSPPMEPVRAGGGPRKGVQNGKRRPSAATADIALGGDYSGPWSKCRGSRCCGLVQRFLRVFGPGWRGIIGDGLTMRSHPESPSPNATRPASPSVTWLRPPSRASSPRILKRFLGYFDMVSGRILVTCSRTVTARPSPSAGRRPGPRSSPSPPPGAPSPFLYLPRTSLPSPCPPQPWRRPCT